VVELAYTHDLKSCALRLVGSSPTPSTTTQPPPFKGRGLCCGVSLQPSANPFHTRGARGGSELNRTIEFRASSAPFCRGTKTKIFLPFLDFRREGVGGADKKMKGNFWFCFAAILNYKSRLFENAISRMLLRC
jgi:hypothetical protein